MTQMGKLREFFVTGSGVIDFFTPTGFAMSFSIALHNFWLFDRNLNRDVGAFIGAGGNG